MFAKAHLVGTLKTYPQVSNQKDIDGLEGLFYVTIAPAIDQQVPAHLLKMRSFDWVEGNGNYYGRKQSAQMSDALGDYCLYLYDQVKALGGCVPGDEVELDTYIYPVRQAVQRTDSRNQKTGDIHLLVIPKYYFILDGQLRKAKTNVK